METATDTKPRHMENLTRPILTESETGSAGEIQGMIQVLMSELGASQYKITVENQQVWLRSEVEDCDTSYPLSGMLAMYRTNQIHRMFINPEVIPRG
jgi:hypothetical protein